MNYYTQFGREMDDAWEHDVPSFCEEMGISTRSPIGQALSALSAGEFKQLTQVISLEDYLINVNSEGFTINHGNVGSGGITYYFN